MERFGKRELAVVRSQLAEAEALLSRFYCIPDREWKAYPYDVKTMGDLPQQEIAEDILALIAKYEYCSRGSSGGKRVEFYGICLQDHNILAASARQSEGISFEPLMLYILTHELVHIFRFASQPHRYFVNAHLRVAEERSVHRITNNILCLKNDPRLLPVLGAYQDYPFVSAERFS
jgi:hypothetical protein